MAVEESVERKVFVLDTSAIMSLVQDVTTYRGYNTPAFAGVLGDNEIVIPRVVLDELNALRRATGEKSKTALECARQLEYYSTLGSLLDGVETEKGGLLRMAPRPATEKVVAWGLKANVADHEILATAMELEDALKANYPSSVAADSDDDDDLASQVILITQDRILRVLARSIYGIAAEELKSICAPEVDHSRGYRRVEVSSEQLDTIIDQGYFPINQHAFVNDFFHIVDRENPEVHYCYAVFREPVTGRAELVDRTKVDYLKVAGEVTGKNIRQKLLLWSLMGCGEPDPSAPGGIRLLTVSGPA